jgi:uncharacterized membrane protein (Fun14 family)
MVDKQYIANSVLDAQNAISYLQQKNKTTDKISFPHYALEIITDVGLGVILGLSVNIATNFIGRIFKLNRVGILLVQLCLITIVLYVIKIESKHLYSSWKGKTDYGIIFISVFMASQKNVVRFFEDVYVEEENNIGLFHKIHGKS